jgi:2-polyprenyl-3-methyl-5-hydroxy-6-metoxy-1,4-benzoquinol methylase
MEASPGIEERLHGLLHHLGVDRVHLAGWVPRDWSGFVAKYPEAVLSLTLINTFDRRLVEPISGRVLVITGDRGAAAETVRNAMTGAAGIRHLELADYNILGWSDVAGEQTDEFARAMLGFLSRCAEAGGGSSIQLPEGDGEVAGISYRIRGAGPALVLLPLFLTPTQWEPLIPLLSEHYCTITLGGAALGPVAILEARGHAIGYVQMVRTLIEVAELRAGEVVLEVGCGSGVLMRWLAQRTAGRNSITGIDISSYLLGEAKALVRREGLESALAFCHGNAEALPFSENSFDVVMSVTVIEEADADRMCAEMVRVTKRGGRVAVIARAVDMAFPMNLSLSATLKGKVEAPGFMGQASPQGCGDASLYRRFRQAGLTRVKMLPQLAAFDHAASTVVGYLEDFLLQKLDHTESQEWHAARAEAETRGTFFMAWPHHCVVGTKA